MEAVLHIEKIEREVDFPLSFGDTDYLYYGESNNDDGMDEDAYTAEMRVGHPMTMADVGSTLSVIPMVKTFGVSKALDRNAPPLLTETTHVLADDKYLIPFKSKVHVGTTHAVRLSHLPGLRHIRNKIIGYEPRPQDPMGDIMEDLMTTDVRFQKKKAHPVMEWARDDLSHILANQAACPFGFAAKLFDDRITQFSNAILDVPYDLQRHNMRDVGRSILLQGENTPVDFCIPDVVSYSISTLRAGAIRGGDDLQSHGPLNVNHVPKMVRNPSYFNRVVEFFDQLPLTDINVDLLVTPRGEISLFHVNVAVNRMSWYSSEYPDRGIGEELLRGSLDSNTIRKIVKSIATFHPMLSHSESELLVNHGVKLKIIKTIMDELTILIYPYQSDEKADPICGVYFDISLLSLAPLSIVPSLPSF